MILRTKGKAVNLEENIVGMITRDGHNLENNLVYISENASFPQNFSAVLTTDNEVKGDIAGVCKIPTLSHLEEGDIVSISTDGNINTLYRKKSFHNSILVTERCNSNCLMCSQPPKDKNDIPYLYEVNRKLISLIPKDCIELGISGGEPTIMGEYFFKIIEQLKEELPNTELHLLTNGRTFAWNQFAEKLGKINHKGLMIGIPLYSDFYQVHDYIVQAPNAFTQTILGLHNLARYNQRLELRIVLHKQSIPRLTKLAKYIYKNLPFVEHIAFMGLEHIGYTPYNMEKLWIDPYDYRNELEEAVNYLDSKGMNVSIYNTPLCVIPETIWENARRSISDWKQEYLPQCEGCSVKDECGGFFRWNLKKYSNYIKPII